MQHRPLTVNTHNWCDVSTEPGQITVKGGFNRKGASADAIQYRCEDDVTHTFVALHKDATWFVKGVGGSEKGSLKAVQVLAMLRRKANATDFVSHDTEHCPAVAGSDSQNTTSSAADEADPMESMISTDCVAASLTEFVKKNTKKRKVEKVVRSCVQELTVPLRPACVGTASLEEVTIFVYTPPTKKKRSPPPTCGLYQLAVVVRSRRIGLSRRFSREHMLGRDPTAAKLSRCRRRMLGMGLRP